MMVEYHANLLTGKEWSAGNPCELRKRAVSRVADTGDIQRRDGAIDTRSAHSCGNHCELVVADHHDRITVEHNFECGYIRYLMPSTAQYTSSKK
jgi:hypothetical protein